MSNYQSVLIVDDDPTQIAILTAYFSGLAVKTISSASDSAKALSVLGSEPNRYDLIVTDIQMPNMDGLEFMRHLNELGFEGRLAIISSIDSNLLEHAARLAKMQRLNLIGKIGKPLKKDALDAVFKMEKQVVASDASQEQVVITQATFSQALINDEIKPYYQPKICVQTGEIVGAEALARWEVPGKPNVPVDQFLNFAEKNSRIEELTFFLFDRALIDIKKFLAIDPALKFAVNLAPSMVSKLSLPDQLNDRMKAQGIGTKNIGFEITENRILNLDPVTLEVLSRLRILDFDVAIDDFGTGSSNIQTLRDFPYSELKIDKAFISEATTDAFSRETVLAAVAFAKELNMRIVAEGVEDLETWEFIKAQGIGHAQGFLMAKPMPASEFEAFVAENKPNMDLSKISA